MSKALQIFKTGTHTAMSGDTLSFSDVEIRDLVDSYDPSLSAAPLVKGHPRTDDPAHGWVAEMAVTEDGVVEAIPDQVEPTFAQEVNEGRYRYISAAIYLADSAGNPKPGHLYLKHVGFLGAASPAVKGLRQAAFAEDGERIVTYTAELPSTTTLQWAFQSLSRLFRNLRDKEIERDGVEAADKIIPDYMVEDLDRVSEQLKPEPAPAPGFSEPTGESVMPNESTAAEQAAFAEQQRQLQADRDALEAERAEIAAERKAAADAAFAAHKSQCQSFVAGLVDSGRILPRFKDSLAAALTELPPGTEVEFSEGDGTKKADALAVVREVLESLPKAMQYGQEMSTPAAETPAAAASFSVPEGMEVDAEGLAHYGRAQAYMQKHQCDYLTAVRATVAN